jgi:predicted O-methyltransferase YrrM
MTLPEGWLTGEEAGALAELARGKVVLELGAWLGRSTVALAKVAELVVSVDHHRGSAEHQPGGVCFDPTLVTPAGVDTLPRFLSNLRLCGVPREKVVVVVARIEDVAPLLRDDAFDVVFVDADHATEAVVRDGMLAFRVVKPGGAVAFHDANWESVRLGFDLMRLGSPARLHGSLGVFFR